MSDLIDQQLPTYSEDCYSVTAGPESVFLRIANMGSVEWPTQRASFPPPPPSSPMPPASECVSGGTDSDDDKPRPLTRATLQDKSRPRRFFPGKPCVRLAILQSLYSFQDCLDLSWM